jgi:hypothetical protein
MQQHKEHVSDQEKKKVKQFNFHAGCFGLAKIIEFSA